VPDLPPELWLLLPLAVAAGIDLYLTLLLIGAAPTMPWWSHPLPGALGDLDAPAILIVVGVVYTLEFAAERRPASALVWNGVHALIRPVSGALLASLLLHGQGTALLLGGSLVAGLLAWSAHAVRSGAAILRWLDPEPDPSVLLVSMFEDALVLALVVWSLDTPPLALVACGGVVLLGLPHMGSRVRSFVFALRFANARVFQMIRRRSWTPNEGLPGWVRASLSDDVMAPGGGLRGARAALLRMPGLPRFATGWVVIRAGAPAFVYGPRGLTGSWRELSGLRAVEVAEDDFFRRLDLQDAGGRTVRAYFFVNGPSPEALASEFGLGIADALQAPEKNL